MKSLIAYLECDGAATPASTMGMGNPMAPGPDGSLGSGDTFDHQKAKAKKEKRRKSDKEVRWDKKPESLQAFMEGIMDTDIDVDDISLIPSIINLNTPMATIETQLKTLFRTNKKLAQQTKFKTTGNWVCFMHDKDNKIYMELIDGSDKEVISFFPGRSKAIDYDISMCDLDDLYDPEEAVRVYGNAPWESWKIKDKALWKALIHNSYKVFNVTSNG